MVHGVGPVLDVMGCKPDMHGIISPVAGGSCQLSVLVYAMDGTVSTLGPPIAFVTEICIRSE